MNAGFIPLNVFDPQLVETTTLGSEGTTVYPLKT